MSDSCHCITEYSPTYKAIISTPSYRKRRKKKKDSRHISQGAGIMCQVRGLSDALQAEVPLHINTCGVSRTISWVWGKMMVWFTFGNIARKKDKCVISLKIELNCQEIIFKIIISCLSLCHLCLLGSTWKYYT